MSDRIHIATRKGLFIVDRSAQGAWRITGCGFYGDHVPIVAHDSRRSRAAGDGTLYAALQHGHFGGKVHRSRDRGESWEEIGVPAYPEPPVGYQIKPHPFSGKIIPWKLRMIWSIVPGGADQPGRLWCGTLPGGLFKSDDDGATWSLVRSLWDKPEREDWFGGGYDEAGIHSVCVDPRNSRRLGVAVSCGGAWWSEDDGQTWRLCATGMRADYMPPERAYEENAQDPHIMVRCPAQPEKLWVQHHNGIFKSVDEGKNWKELDRQTPSSFGFATAVHPRDGDIAWFVPAHSDEKRITVEGKIVVLRTRDGGKSFDQLRVGLPQEHAYDLTFRHALDVDETGEVLCFGTTTGSVWLSENGGDSWQTISSNLPPVYCVRFEKSLA